MSRNHDRKDFDHETRTALLEGDADEFETAVTGMQKTMQRIVASLIGATITLATSSILLALNLIMTR